MSRPVRDDIFVTADFNRRAVLAKSFPLSRRDNILRKSCCLSETKATNEKLPAD
jgi:hypothetical protein